MTANERLAKIAAYYMARFNYNFGHETQVEAFQKIEEITGISANTVRVCMRDTFDCLFPWRKGWQEENFNKYWTQYELEEVFKQVNLLSEEQLRKTLVLFGVWNI